MSHEVLGEGRFLRLVRRDGWEYVERPGIGGIVAIVAVTGEGNLVLIEQERPPVRARVLEIPAGLAGDSAADRGEPLAAAAARELHEETGYRAGTMDAVARGTPSAGQSDEVIHFFLAGGLVKDGEGGGDGSERITVHEVALARVRDFVEERAAAGVLVDLKVYVALALLS